MNAPRQIQAKAKSSTPAFFPTWQSGLLQRKCACGGTLGIDGECADCRQKQLQRKTAQQGEPTTLPSIVHDVLRSPGQPLDLASRAFMEPRFGHNFSQVRVHTDARAADSALAVNALAYTAGKNVVFGANQYQPDSNSGRKLLAHELTHVLQQGQGAQRIDTHEREAELISEQIVTRSALATDFRMKHSENSQPMAVQATNATPTIMRQQPPAGGGTAQTDPIEQARASAWHRCFRAYTRVAGIGPPPPPGRPDPAENWQRRARHLARVIFRESLNMDQVAEIVSAMRDRLGPGLQTVRAPANDQECGGLRGAYVVGNRPPIHLCPSFFLASAQEQMITMIHEAAHMAGIGEGSGNEYCFYIDCESEPGCGGFNFADSWTQFVMCLSG